MLALREQTEPSRIWDWQENKQCLQKHWKGIVTVNFVTRSILSKILHKGDHLTTLDLQIEAPTPKQIIKNSI